MFVVLEDLDTMAPYQKPETAEHVGIPERLMTAFVVVAFENMALQDFALAGHCAMCSVVGSPSMDMTAYWQSSVVHIP